MIFVRQKTKHCAIACLVSALEEKRLDDLQSAIVAQFPKQCSAGTENEGMVYDTNDFMHLVLSLGLAQSVHFEFSPEKVRPLLLKNAKADPRRMFLMAEFPTNHTVRVKEIRDDGIEVMDPGVGFTFWPWSKVDDSKPCLAILL